MDIEFQGQFEKSQYLEAIRLAGTPKKWSTIWRVILFVGFTALAAVYAFTAMQDGEAAGNEISRFIRYGLAIAVLGYFIFRPYIAIRQTANRLWNDPLVRRTIQGTVSSQGITYGTLTTPWSDFAFKHVTDDLVVLLTADRTMSALPHSFFRDESDWQRFRQMVEHHVMVAK